MDKNNRLIFHIDVNSAFLSWEAVKRIEAGEPDLRLIPSAVGGDKNKRTSIIAAKSIPAGKFKIRTGEPVSMAIKKCPDLIVVSPDFEQYRKCSKAFISICREYAPVLEQFSIDECFLDMSGTELIYKDPIATAYEIKNRIKEELKFTVNIGIGSNKLLAKMASDFEKPDKVHTLFANEIERKMWPLPIDDLFLAGSASAGKLKRVCIKTIGDLAKSDVEYIKSVVGNKMGDTLYNYANGYDDSEVVSESDRAKSFSMSTTLEENISDGESAHGILRMLADNVALKMRHEGLYAYCIGVTIRTPDFVNKSHQVKLENPTNISKVIEKVACDLFDEIWVKGTPIRLLNVSLSNITDELYEQQSLFEDVSVQKEKAMDRVVDVIFDKYGKGVLQRGFDSGRKR